MYEKRSIAPNVEGGESLALFCAGHAIAGSLFLEVLTEHSQERVARMLRPLKTKA